MGNISRTEVKKHEANSQNFVSKTRKPCCSKTRSSPVDRILFLQRTIGNQAVQRLMKSGALQAKLKIGAPGDVYEQEADRVAEQVMRMPEPQALSSDIPSIQRVCPKCENDELKRQPIKEEDEEEKMQRKPVEEEEDELQAKATSGSITEVNPDLESHIQSFKGGGQSLSENERAFFEPRFGQDFSQVRLHSGGAAEQSARDVNANAYTVGHNIVFGAGQLSLGTQKGRHLLAHELTHVVQQSGSNGLYVGQVGEKRGMTPIAHTIQQTEQINREDAKSSTPAAAAPVGTADITLETGNIGAGFLNNLVHQQICVDRYGPGRKRCFSFAASGAQLPQFSSKWLGWSSLVIGAILKGEVYEPPPVSGATIVSRHTPTTTQGARWLDYILSTRLGLQDGYSVARHNCRTFSQWEFRDAPSHW